MHCFAYSSLDLNFVMQFPWLPRSVLMNTGSIAAPGRQHMGKALQVFSGAAAACTASAW